MRLSSALPRQHACDRPLRRLLHSPASARADKAVDELPSVTKLIRIGNNARKMIVQIFALRFNLPLLITSAATPTVNARPALRRVICRTRRRANKKIFAICPERAWHGDKFAHLDCLSVMPRRQRPNPQIRGSDDHALRLLRHYQRARRCIAQIVMAVYAMVDTVSPARARPSLKRRELRHQLLAIDKLRPPRREQRQAFNINLRTIALAVNVAHASPRKALRHKPRRVFVARDRRDAIALEQRANLGNCIRRRERRLQLMREIKHNRVAILVRNPKRKRVLPNPARTVDTRHSEPRRAAAEP